MKTSIILAHIGGFGHGGAAVLIAIFAIAIILTAICLFQQKSPPKEK